MPGRLKALFLLTWALIRTLVLRAFGRRKPGLALFHERYAADRLTHITIAQRPKMAGFGRCIACGRCNRNDASRIAKSKGQFRGTMSLVLAASRSMPEYQAAAAGFKHLSESDLREKERLCPVGVPLAELARFVAEHAKAANESSPPRAVGGG